MQKITKYLQDNIFHAFIVFIALLTIVPISAPILQFLGIEILANSIYTAFLLSCHQFHWRSMHFFDYQVAWCTRDMFIWIGFLAIGLALKFKYIKKGLAWYWMLLFTIPIALDGGIQTIATILGFGSDEQFYLATNLTRMITGTIFGMGLGIVISGFLLEEQNISRKTLSFESENQINKKINYIKLFFQLALIFLLIFISYIGMVWVWKITSPNYPPIGLVDDIKREAPAVHTWQAHRGDHGVKDWFIQGEPYYQEIQNRDIDKDKSDY